MAPTITRSRGRPRSFDEIEALENAIRIFRSKGYDGVTIDDLVGAMGVGRPSLYSIFGDKRAIFLRAIRVYAEQYGALAAKALFSPQTVHAALAGFLRNVVENATAEGSAPGCLVVCVAPLVDDAEVRQFVQDVAASGAAQLERRFRDGVSAGELPSDFPASARAMQVMDLARGLTMRAQMGAPRKTLLKDAEEAARFALLPLGETPAL